MHWTVAGADANIALRCKEASSTGEALTCLATNSIASSESPTDPTGAARAA
jgi:hypothetical protein